MLLCNITAAINKFNVELFHESNPKLCWISSYQNNNSLRLEGYDHKGELWYFSTYALFEQAKMHLQKKFTTFLRTEQALFPELF